MLMKWPLHPQCNSQFCCELRVYLMNLTLWLWDKGFSLHDYCKFDPRHSSHRHRGETIRSIVSALLIFSLDRSLLWEAVLHYQHTHPSFIIQEDHLSPNPQIMATKTPSTTQCSLEKGEFFPTPFLSNICKFHIKIISWRENFYLRTN